MGVEFRGGTAFCLAAMQLGFLVDSGDFFTPGIAIVPDEDVEAFIELLAEKNIPFHRATKLKEI